MDAVQHDQGLPVREPPGEDDEEAPGNRVQQPGASFPPGELHAALPGLIQAHRDKWEISLADGLFTGRRRDYDADGAVTYPPYGPVVACTDPVMFDAELRKVTR